MQQFQTFALLRWAVLAWLLAAALGARAAAFGFDDVVREAERLARQPYGPPPAADPRLAALSYDELRRIRFRPEHSSWRGSGLPFELQFFPLGRGNTRALQMFEVVNGQARPLNLPASAFDRDGVLPEPPTGTAAQVAGWRLNRWGADPKHSDELMVFLGASYFRTLADGLRYGVSARGLAVDTVGGHGEEFPAFTRFWIERPAPGATEVRWHALLEGPRVAGAYQFVLRPQGARSTVEVQARLWLRGPVATLGLAPLTSMFLAGENQPVADDYRPEVHDSDGLQIASGSGEWLWRPLSNPSGVFVSSFALRSLRGFGLMQRDRDFASYQDLEARYDLRPSAWVEPIGDWGPGRVELLQFATPNETHDNIAAYWVPEQLPAPGTPLALGWRITVSADQPRPPGAWVVQSRLGHGYREAAIPAGKLQFHLDFDGPALQGLAPDAVEAVASGNDNLRGLRAIAQPNPVRGGWRVTLDAERIDARRPVELRAFLRSGGRTLSETWAYALAPE
jgi:periplasmic glucans biosynthesis protein